MSPLLLALLLTAPDQTRIYPLPPQRQTYAVEFDIEVRPRFIRVPQRGGYDVRGNGYCPNGYCPNGYYPCPNGHCEWQGQLHLHGRLQRRAVAPRATSTFTPGLLPGYLPGPVSRRSAP